MPNYIEPSLVVPLNAKTQFIIDQYESALIETGLITQDKQAVSDSLFDERLLAKVKMEGQGIAKKMARGVEKIFDTPKGGYERILDKIGFDISDMNLGDFYEMYTAEWSTCLNTLKSKALFSSGLSDEQIDSTDLQNPYVLIMRLMIRLVLFTISDANLTKIDHQKYFNAMDLFIKKIIQKEIVFGSVAVFDSMRKYLQEEHSQSLKSFKTGIESLQEFVVHKKAIRNMRELMDGVNKIIQRQLIVYLNPESSKAALADINYRRNLQEMEDNLLKINQEKIKKALDNPSLPRHALLILILQDKKHEYFESLVTLYNLLLRVEDIRRLIDNLDKLIEGTGWICLLSDFLKLSELGIFLEKFYKDTAKALDITQNKALPDKARNVLFINEAANLDKLNALPRTINENTRRIENKSFQEKIFNMILNNIHGIFQEQKLLDIQIINPDFAKIFSIGVQHSIRAIDGAYDNESIAVPAAAATIGLFKPKAASHKPAKSEPVCEIPMTELQPTKPTEYVSETVASAPASEPATISEMEMPMQAAEPMKTSPQAKRIPFTVRNRLCDVSERNLSQYTPEEIAQLFADISQLDNIDKVSFKNNGFDGEEEHILDSYNALTQNLHLLPASVITLDLSKNGFELINRMALDKLFSKIPTTVKMFLLIENKDPQSRRVWLERVTWPTSYDDITISARAKRNCIQMLDILLKDYVKGNGFFRFLYAHWNRHHVAHASSIVSDLKDYDKMSDDTAIPREMLISLAKINTPNLCGSFARRISFIQHLNALYFENNILLNGVKKSDQPTFKTTTL